MNFLIAFPISFIFAMISWHLVEERFMKYKSVPSPKVKKKAGRINGIVNI